MSIAFAFSAFYGRSLSAETGVFPAQQHALISAQFREVHYMPHCSFVLFVTWFSEYGFSNNRNRNSEKWHSISLLTERTIPYRAGHISCVCFIIPGTRKCVTKRTKVAVEALAEAAALIYIYSYTTIHRFRQGQFLKESVCFLAQIEVCPVGALLQYAVSPDRDINLIVPRRCK